jgi:hypothetical protein
MRDYTTSVHQKKRGGDMAKRNDLHCWRVVSAAALLTSTAGTAGAADLKNFLTDLYGGNGIFLAPVSPIPFAALHAPHFNADSIQAFARLNDSIVSGVGTPAFNSTVTGITFDVASGVPVETQNSLGPLLVESARTLGKGKVDLAFGYSRIKYDRLDGRKLDNYLLDMHHNDCCTAGNPEVPPPDGAITGFENDEIEVRVKTKLNFDVLGLFANYGITDRWDVGVVVPVIRAEARANAHAEVLAISGSNIHTFEGQSNLQNSRTGGTKTGIGDVIVRTKYNLLRESGSAPDLAVLAQVTAPTGDDDNLLGTGETKYKAGVITSKNFGTVGTHLNLAYEMTTGPKVQDNMTYAAGVDLRASSTFTVGADFLGRWNPDQEEIGSNVVDFALSAKWNPFKGMNAPFNAYIIVPVNKDQGLRSDLVYGVGFDFVL